MRCSEAFPELDAAFGRPLDSPELAAHLAACPQCAAHADRDRQLAQVWSATRPAVPSSAIWNAAWDQIQAAVRPAETPLASGPTRSRRLIHRGAIATLLAAAAALVIAILIPDRSDPGLIGPSDPGVMAGVPSPELPLIDVGVGETILYQVDEGERIVIQTNEPDQFDSFLVFHGLAEFEFPDSLAMNDNVVPVPIPH